MESYDDLIIKSSVRFRSSYPLVVPISVIVAVLCLCILIGHLVKKSRWLNESTVTVLIGCAIGTIILFWSKGTNSHILRFNEELFFIYLLPPIIFNAGFKVKKKQFFRNFSTIVLFGVFGCFLSSGIIAAGSWLLLPLVGFTGLKTREYFALGAIFSSTDTVSTLQVLNANETPLLYSLVFGEGVVNDATSVVLLKAIQRPDISIADFKSVAQIFADFFYLFSMSTVLGVFVGLLTAYALKKIYFAEHSTDREIALLVLMSYLSYMLAELLNLSGILTVFLCGIIMSHYAYHNVSDHSKVTARHASATMSFIAETFIFLYLGMDVLDIEKWNQSNSSFGTSLGIQIAIILLICLGRAAFVFPISALTNYMNKNYERTHITFKSQIIIWWAGLMRGAVTIALAFNQFTYKGEAGDFVHATLMKDTLIIVLFTTVVLGSITKPLVRLLVPHHELNNESQQNTYIEELNLPLISLKDSTSTNMLRAKNSLTMLIKRPIYTIHDFWRRFDDTYMRPVFGGPPLSGNSLIILS
ncbi:Sodium/hydrogen exchanger [Thalictrum thalictroides]|uniref:Sodium/hydrogen exchanger n=1 Tax=Thalictrum thalictroides TaxID=46969 RepID=A0A7J6X452_THATH|nr:Sodium/hydrogen exchanger [Thalictrum thalictroides]